MTHTSLEMMLTAVETAGRGRAKAAAVKGFIHDEDFRWYWYNALSPFIHFNLTMSPRDILLSGPLSSPSPELVDLLDRIAAGEVSGRVAKQTLKAELVRHTRGLQRYLVAMINKEPRLGISIGGIQAADPDLVPVFQLPLAPAKEIDWNKVIYPCITSPKVDGLRGIYENGELYSRGGNKFQGLTWLQDVLSIFKEKEPRLKRLDGEVTATGMHFDEISGKLRSFHETRDAHYHIFDMVIDFDEPLAQRLERLKSLFLAVADDLPGCFLLPNVTCADKAAVIAEYTRHLGNGWEGAMVKDAKSVYFTGRKPDWQKLKPTHTIDLVVTDVVYGDEESRLAGQIASLVCSGGGTSVSVGSGLSDPQRLEWASNPGLIVGKTIEVKYMEKSSKDSLRHPRLIKVRGDK